MNKIIMIGRLSKDVELRYTQGGMAIGSFDIATSRKTKKQDGTTHEEVCYVTAKVFGRQAEIANQYLKKGSKLGITGRLVLEQWEKDGKKFQKHAIAVEEIEFLDTKSQTQQAPAPQTQSQPKQAPQQNIPEVEIDDEEIPF